MTFFLFTKINSYFQKGMVLKTILNTFTIHVNSVVIIPIMNLQDKFNFK